MDGNLRKRLLAGQWRQSYRLWIGVMIAAAMAAHLQAAETAATHPRAAQAQPRAGQAQPSGGGQPATRPTASRSSDRTTAKPPTRSPKVDHAVMPAGGMPADQGRCSQCQRSACPQCRLAETHHHGHSQCQHGLCPAHCPVRPDVFGFYGTRWRRWPGSGVVQASNNEAATPARPPRAEVPEADEESLGPDPAAEDLPAPAAEELPEKAEKMKAEKIEPAEKLPAADDSQSSARPTPGDDAAAVVEDPGDASAEDLPAAARAARDPMPEDSGDTVASPTAWRTFTATPPRLAGQR